MPVPPFGEFVLAKLGATLEKLLDLENQATAPVSDGMTIWRPPEVEVEFERLREFLPEIRREISTVKALIDGTAPTNARRAYAKRLPEGRCSRRRRSSTGRTRLPDAEDDSQRAIDCIQRPRAMHARASQGPEAKP